MAFQFSTTYRNAILDQLETTIGTSAILTLRTGAAPADCATANSGSLIAQINLPSDWMAAASAGSKAKSGTWANTSVGGTGTIAHFRIHDSLGTACHLQGTCSNTGGGADMELDNTVVNAGQSITITTFTLTAPGA
jgi:hypothetical protein